MNAFDVLLERGFIATEEDGTPKQVTDMKIRDILEKKNISCYIGFDPTATSLHVGSLVQIMVLAHMQRAGHRPIALVGGGTAMVGDPSGKSEMRKMLTAEDIEQNMGYKEMDGSPLLDEKAKFKQPILCSLIGKLCPVNLATMSAF